MFLNIFLDKPLISPDALCGITFFFYYYSRWNSSWFLAIITLERMLAVLYPHKVHLWVTKLRIAFCMATITLILFGTNVCLTLLATHRNLRCHFDMPDEILAIDVAVGITLPWVIITLGNSLIIVEMIRNMRSLGESRGHQPHRLHLTVTLVVVSVTFFLLTVPNVVFHFVPLGVRLNSEMEIMSDFARNAFVVDVLQCLDYINNGINLYIYCLVGRQFRQKLGKKLCSICFH